MTRNHPNRSILVMIAVAALLSTVLGCATASVSGQFPTAHVNAVPMRLFVMPANTVRNPSTGNVGFSFVDVQRVVDDRVLAVAREKDSSAALTPVDSEINAANYARLHGGTHLLVPTIVEWHQMRTDDPVGAFMLHNRIAIELRLIRLDSSGVDGDVTFNNHSRATFNQSAAKLLGDEFSKTVKKLLAE